ASKVANDAAERVATANKAFVDANKTANDASEVADRAHKALVEAAKIANDAGDADRLREATKEASKVANDAGVLADKARKIRDAANKASIEADERLTVAENARNAANKASLEAGDANVLGDKVEEAKKALAKAEEDLGPTKAERAEVALKLEAARNAADDAARELTDLEKAIAGAKSEFEAKRVAYEVASGLKECAPIVPPAPVEPTPAPQPEPAPAPVPSDKVIAQKSAEGKKLANTGATTDSSIAVAMASVLGGLGLVAAARHTPRHRRGL
ncbi:hypothetical protein V3M92_09750, partial [Trueperella pyogenes]